MTTLKVEINDSKVLKGIIALFQSMDLPCEIDEDVDENSPEYNTFREEYLKILSKGKRVKSGNSLRDII